MCTDCTAKKKKALVFIVFSLPWINSLRIWGIYRLQCAVLGLHTALVYISQWNNDSIATSCDGFKKTFTDLLPAL